MKMNRQFPNNRFCVSFIVTDAAWICPIYSLDPSVLNAVRCMAEDGTLPLEKIAAFAGLLYDEVKAIAEGK